MRFRDRTEAGRSLAERLLAYARPDVVVLGLPRGGVPIADQVARRLGAPLDVIIVRKLGVPFQPELAMGAIGENGARTLNNEVIRLTRVTADDIARVEASERQELERRAMEFRGHRPRVELAGKTALIIDDGLATGSTAKAACQVARAHGATKVIVAVPVASPDAAARLAGDADEFVALAMPEGFQAVGQFYENFSQVSDQEVLDILDRSLADESSSSGGSDCDDDPPIRNEDVELTVAGARLSGHLEIPEDPIGVVLFAHGSGSSRHSPRNKYVADVLHAARIGTLLFDLLTVEEELDRSNVFDVELLGTRLRGATDWLRAQPEATELPIGYFGASTGAAAALWAAADPTTHIAAVVSRGGRPDLAGARLELVHAPTMLIVGGHDPVVADLNRDAATHLRCETRLAIIPGATHLFEEPGTLTAAASVARDWFAAHMAPGHRVTTDGAAP
jgi:putative phosphoribosyl transferase